MLSKAIVAVECENSLGKGQLMPDYGAELKPQKRLKWQSGLEEKCCSAHNHLERSHESENWAGANNAKIG